MRAGRGEHLLGDDPRTRNRNFWMKAQSNPSHTGACGGGCAALLQGSTGRAGSGKGGSGRVESPGAGLRLVAGRPATRGFGFPRSSRAGLVRDGPGSAPASRCFPLHESRGGLRSMRSSRRFCYLSLSLCSYDALEAQLWRLPTFKVGGSYLVHLF